MSLPLFVESGQEPVDSLDYEEQHRNDCEGTSRVASSIIAQFLYIFYYNLYIFNTCAQHDFKIPMANIG